MLGHKELTEFAVSYGQSKNCDFLEARYVDSRDEGYTTRNGVILGGGVNTSSGIGIRILYQGNIAFVSTANLTKESIEKIIDIGISMAKSSKRTDPIVFSPEDIVQTKWQTPIRSPFEEIAIEEKQLFLKNVDDQLVATFGKDLPNRTLMLELSHEKKYIVNSEGSQIESIKSQPIIHTFNTALGKYGSEQRFYGRGGTGGWEWFEQEKISNLILADTNALVKSAKKAEPMKLNSMDVIVSSEVAGIMAHENVGHPSESDRIFGREGAQAGESFYIDLINSGELGNIQLGNPEVTIIDDPTLEGSSGYYLYDDECVKAKPRELIKNGMLNELLLNREFAHQCHTTSNAAARASRYDREPIVRMANTYFKPGSFTLDELVEDVKQGMFMKSFTEWNIDDRRYQSKYVGLECYVIENGEITDKMIRRPILELTTRGILESVDGVSKNFDAPHGTCGKCDPMQGVPVWMGGGEVRMRNIRLGASGEEK